MSDSQHTPTPWKFTRTHGCSSDTWYVITDAKGFGPIVEVGGKDVSGQVAEAKHLITDPSRIEANAAYIVRCVNAHQQLVEALKTLCSKLWTLNKLDDGGCRITCECCESSLTFTSAEEALAATEWPFAPMRHNESCPLGCSIDALLAAGEQL